MSVVPAVLLAVGVPFPPEVWPGADHSIIQHLLTDDAEAAAPNSVLAAAAPAQPAGPAASRLCRALRRAKARTRQWRSRAKTYTCMVVAARLAADKVEAELVEIKKAKGEGFLSKSAELVGSTNPNEIRTGITFIIEIHGSTKSSINIKSEKVILCGSILIMKGEGEGSRCVRIGGIEIQHSGTDR